MSANTMKRDRFFRLCAVFKPRRRWFLVETTGYLFKIAGRSYGVHHEGSQWFVSCGECGAAVIGGSWHTRKGAVREARRTIAHADSRRVARGRNKAFKFWRNAKIVSEVWWRERDGTNASGAFYADVSEHGDADYPKGDRRPGAKARAALAGRKIDG